MSLNMARGAVLTATWMFAKVVHGRKKNCEHGFMKTDRLFVFLSSLACAFFLTSMAVAQWGGGPGTEELRLGVQASNLGKLDEAIEHFEKAAQMDGFGSQCPTLPGQGLCAKISAGPTDSGQHCHGGTRDRALPEGN